MFIDEMIKQLNLDSDTFADVKRDWNFVFQRLMANMTEKESSEGSITLKMDVSLESEFIPNYDPDVKGESREIHKPKFKHKITSSVQIKDEKSGNMDSEMELALDSETGCYILKPVINTEQKSIFDDDYQEKYGGREKPEDGGEPEDGGTALPGRKVLGLPGAEEPVIEAEFKEVEPEDKGDGGGECPENAGNAPETDGTDAGDNLSGDAEKDAPPDATDALFGDDTDGLPFGDGYADDNEDDGYGYEEPEE